MTQMKMQVLGVYSLPVTDELVEEQADILYGEDLTGKSRKKAEEQCREQLSSAVLIEVLVSGADKSFDVGEFCQPNGEHPEENWQVAWAEAYLSTDGNSLLVDRWEAPPATSDFRVAFFVHYWNPDAPLWSSAGELSCPPAKPMPERLRRLVPYELMD